MGNYISRHSVLIKYLISNLKNVYSRIIANKFKKFVIKKLLIN